MFVNFNTLGPTVFVIYGMRLNIIRSRVCLITCHAVNLKVLFVIHKWKTGDQQRRRNRPDIRKFYKSRIFPKIENIFRRDSNEHVNLTFTLFPKILMYMLVLENVKMADYLNFQKNSPSEIIIFVN